VKIKKQFIRYALVSYLSLFLGLSIFFFYILAWWYQKEWVNTLLSNPYLLLTAILQFLSSCMLILTGTSFAFSWRYFSKNPKSLRKINEFLRKDRKKKFLANLLGLLIVGVLSIPLYLSFNPFLYFSAFLLLAALFLYLLLR